MDEKDRIAEVTRSQFTFYRSYYEAIRRLPPESCGEILLAICGYALDGTAPEELSNIAQTVFTLVKPTLDSGRRKANSGKAGGTSKQNESNGEANRKQTPSKPQANGKQTPSEKEKEGEIEKELEIENECLLPPKAPRGAKRPKFAAPTLAEVQSYVAERHSPVVAQEFIDFYASKGWMVGKTPMKDWKAACRNAEKWDRWPKHTGKENSKSEGKQLLDMIARGDFDD